MNEQGEHARAEPILRECIRLRTEAVGPKDPELMSIRNNLAVAQSYLGRFPEAEQTIRETLALSRELTGSQSWQSLHVQHVLVRVLYGAGKLDVAETLGRETATARRELLGHDDPNVGRSLVILGLVFAAGSKAADADTAFREALAMFRDKSNLDDWVAQAKAGRGAMLVARGRASEAEMLLAEARPTLDADQRIPPWQAQRIRELVAAAYEKAGDLAAAARWRTERAKPAPEPTPPGGR